MAFEQLSNQEQKLIPQCMNAILEGGYIYDLEFHTRLGVGRKELRAIAGDWPGLNDTDPDSDTALAINNCMNEVCYGIAIPGDEGEKWFEGSKQDVEALYSKWANFDGIYLNRFAIGACGPGAKKTPENDIERSYSAGALGVLVIFVTPQYKE